MSELFDFIWPAVSTFVFARSKAYRHRNLAGNARRLALAATFQSPRNLRAQYRSITGLKRANLEKSLLETDWAIHEQVFARLVLVNVFAIYEGWLDDLLDELEPLPRTSLQNKWRKNFITACQFHYTTNKHQDWTWAMGELRAKQSASLTSCLGASLRGKRFYSLQHAINLLRCYRYFKELRNAVIHRNGKVGAALISAANDYSSIVNQNVFGANIRPPEGTNHPLIEGSEVSLSLFGVVGFNDIILRLMSTLDVEAGLTTFGEATMERFFRNRTNKRSLSGNRDATARRMANDYGLVGLEQPSTFVQMLIARGVSMP